MTPRRQRRRQQSTQLNEVHAQYWIAHPVSGRQDGETDILGPDVSLIIVDAASLTAAGGPAPAQIAALVHGTVLAAQALG